MDPAEAAAACHLFARVVADTTTAVEGVHRGILSRVRDGFRASPGVALTVGVIDVPTKAVYGAVRASATGAGHVAAAAATVAVDDRAPRAEHSPRGATVLAGLCCAVGDQLEEDYRTTRLAPTMSFRERGRTVAPSQVAAGQRRVAVFLHGLGGTEFQWDRGYRAALEAQGFACAFIRYNTGRSIHANGTELARLLGEASTGMRSEDGELQLLLVGHSMGGLVIRSALSQASGEPWVAAVTHVVSLGTPHFGAPLEKVSHAALTGMGKVRELRPLAEFGHRRSIGIKDLRFAALHPDHWRGRHPDSVLCHRSVHVPLPPHVEHHAVVARLGPPGSVRGALIGDGLVRGASAAGWAGPDYRTRVHRLYETGHMTLLRHPFVAGLLGDLAGDAGTN